MNLIGRTITRRTMLLTGIGATALVAMVSVHSEVPDTWSGSYSYSESGGRTTGGYGIVVTHEIDVTRAGDGWDVEIKANGYQTQRHVLGRGTAVGNRLVIRFVKDGEEQMFKDRHKPGELLLELERPVRGGLLTHWHAYSPATMERFRNPGTYFKR